MRKAAILFCIIVVGLCIALVATWRVERMHCEICGIQEYHRYLLGARVPCLDERAYDEWNTAELLATIDSDRCQHELLPGPLVGGATSSWTQLHFLAATGAASELTLNALGQSAPAGIDQEDRYGRRPMHWAAASYDPRHSRTMLRQLLEHGARLDAADHQGMTPLHWAAASGNAEATDLLLLFGANASVADGQGHTPLYYATTHGHVSVIERLSEDHE